ncbi:dihydroxyacetone kinase subunit DhaK [Oscillospiraceae bacterium MB08-C2-2]|nr:dihydroxyacetone kinase subunit DhaK [Oscillospiraceae bacterium MB08-C2-2]
MKKILNALDRTVLEMCAGLALANTELHADFKYKFLRKKNIDRSKVSLLSGGGSGHEPAHAGYIGTGMLDVAVCGDVFASPSQIQVYQAIKDSAGDKGVLLIIKNYSGDIMNFQSAAFLAEMDGIEVNYIKVDDDIAVEDSLYTVGRRGVAGTVLVHKLAGAAAQAGLSLAEVKRVAQKTADHVRSLGFAFSSCTVPAKGSPTLTIADDEMEYGVGIHGEPGIRREPVASADQLAQRMVSALLADMKLDVGKPHEIALLVNGFGATPLMELYVFNNSVMGQLAEKGIRVYRTFVGNYMTSLDMEGASLSFLVLDDELKGYLDAKSTAPGFPVDGPAASPVYIPLSHENEDHPVSYKADTSKGGDTIQGEGLSLENVTFLVDKMSEIIIENEVPFCDLDSHAGDGDFGMSVAKGFRQLKREWSGILAGSKTIGEFLDACSVVIMEHCGGASGPIWGFAFKYAAKAAGETTSLTLPAFADIMQAAVEGVQTTGKRSFGRGAVVGDKTLIDALVPCADAWSEAARKGDSLMETFKNAAQAAVQGADKTKEIVARMGRAGTVGERSLGYPDAGAHALGVIFTQIGEALR